MSSKSILIVEDDNDIRGTIREILEAEGYEVLTAANGQEGVEVLKKSKPNLVLLDLMMPVMDGYGFLRSLRESPQLNGMPVVVMTASGLTKAPEGAAALYPKPVGLDQLMKVTHHFCPLSSAS